MKAFLIPFASTAVLAILLASPQLAKGTPYTCDDYAQCNSGMPACSESGVFDGVLEGSVGMIGNLLCFVAALDPSNQPLKNQCACYDAISHANPTAPVASAWSTEAANILGDCAGTAEGSRSLSGVAFAAAETVCSGGSDPFSLMRPPGAYCAPDAYRYEENVGRFYALEINSASCNYLTVQQPSLRDLVVGDRIFLRAAHFALTAPANSQSYLAIQIGTQIIWDVTIDLPANTSAGNPVPYELYVNGLNVPQEIVMEIAAPPGTPIYFHFQNHGENTYYLFELLRGTNEFGSPLVDNDAWELASTGIPASAD